MAGVWDVMRVRIVFTRSGNRVVGRAVNSNGQAITEIVGELTGSVFEGRYVQYADSPTNMTWEKEWTGVSLTTRWWGTISAVFEGSTVEGTYQHCGSGYTGPFTGTGLSETGKCSVLS